LLNRLEDTTDSDIADISKNAVDAEYHIPSCRAYELLLLYRCSRYRWHYKRDTVSQFL
jgi:hypothetical protein